MPGPFDFLHIKHRTAGSSNELSLDVLDAARHQLDAQQKQPKGRRRDRNLSGAAHAAPQTSGPVLGARQPASPASEPPALAAVPEVQRRKRQRLKRGLGTKALITLALIVALCAIVALGYGIYRQQMDFNDHVAELMTSIRSADQDLAQADRLMTDPFNSFEGDQRTAMLQKAPTLLQELGRLEHQTDQLRPQFTGEGEQLTLTEILAVVQARQAMVAAWEQAFTVSDQLNADVQQAELAWMPVMDADQQVREAAAQANGALTEEATRQARSATAQAQEALQQVADQLEALEQQVQGLDLQPQRAYLERRIQALDQALATADALLQGDRQQATQANDAYNRLEGEAAALAAELPASPGDQVRAAYAAQTDQALAAYSEARAWVTKADADLRARL